MVRSSDDSSSEDEAELSRLNQAAVSGADVAAAAAATPSSKRARNKGFVRAGQSGGNSSVGSGRLGIVEDKLWRALAKRLDGDLDCQLATPSAALPHQACDDRDPGDTSPQPADESIRLFRQVQAGVPVVLPSADSTADGGDTAATSRDEQPLTRKRRARLMKQERRRQERARSKETLPLPPADKIAEALKAKGELAHFTAGMMEDETDIKTDSTTLSKKERKKLWRIAKNERRKKASAEVRAAKQLSKTEHHRKKYHIKQLKKQSAARKAEGAAKAELGEANGAAFTSSQPLADGDPLAAAHAKAKVKAKKRHREKIGVRRGKFSKAKVKKRVHAKRATMQKDTRAVSI